MKVPCEVVRDLLPLYHDQICSAESRRLTEEHLAHCEACRKDLQMMDAPVSARHAHLSETEAAEAASAAWKKGKRSAFRKGAALAAAACLVLLFVAVSGVLYVRNLPVSRDANAQEGSYAARIFEKYGQELTQKFADSLSEKDEIASAEAIDGTQQASWEDRTLFFQFDIQVESSRGTEIQRVYFVGHRIWFDTYAWSSAIPAKG